MISAPGTGCSSTSFCRSTSAGGHDEHPSEVNSSTRTGLRLSSLCAALVLRAKATKTRKEIAAAVAKSFIQALQQVLSIKRMRNRRVKLPAAARIGQGHH